MDVVFGLVVFFGVAYLLYVEVKRRREERGDVDGTDVPKDDRNEVDQ